MRVHQSVQASVSYATGVFISGSMKLFQARLDSIPQRREDSTRILNYYPRTLTVRINAIVYEHNMLLLYKTSFSENLSPHFSTVKFLVAISSKKYPNPGPPNLDDVVETIRGRKSKSTGLDISVLCRFLLLTTMCCKY